MAAADLDPDDSGATSTPPARLDWPLLARLPQLLAEGAKAPSAFRAVLGQAHEELKARFLADEPVEALVHARAALIDSVLQAAWHTHTLASMSAWALIAVGGYGRGELHLCSDIDILLLAPR